MRTEQTLDGSAIEPFSTSLRSDLNLRSSDRFSANSPVDEGAEFGVQFRRYLEIVEFDNFSKSYR
ncbi:hypothetical protein [Baaleninema sp.]|uniref:hypothetical protein n=1 Tax=Baaleninema sp. TaxID=3101197 RepID=UPI003D05C5E5